MCDRVPDLPTEEERIATPKWRPTLQKHVIGSLT